MLSEIPEYKRSFTVMSEINTFIQRFCDIREKYNIVDENGYVIGFKKHNSQPLINELEEANIYLPWVKPVVSEKRKIYGPYNGAIVDGVIVDQLEEMEQDKAIKKAVYTNNGTSVINKYADGFIQTASFTSTFVPFTDVAIHTLKKVKKKSKKSKKDLYIFLRLSFFLTCHIHAHADDPFWHPCLPPLWQG